MILVLAGTLEGRQTAALLQMHGFQVTASAVTDYGACLLRSGGVTSVLTGTLDQLALQQLLLDGYRLLVDATHPYASVASQTAMAAAQQLGISYLRLERMASEIPEHPLIYKIGGLGESIDQAVNKGKVVFSTLGSKNLSSLVATARKVGVKVVARVLPEVRVIESCLELGLAPADIVALQGPCTVELNKALFDQYQAEVVLTKESGSTGGVDTKITAALELGIPIVVWQRPQLNYPLVVNSSEEVLEYCLKQVGRS